MSKKKVIGICELCKKKRELKQSHAIPSAFFKSTLGKTGHALIFDTDTKFSPQKIGNVIKGNLLCCCCEKHLNENFERNFIPLIKTDSLRGKNTIIVEKKEGNTIKFKDKDITGKHLMTFVISILWRMSLLDIDFYKDFNLPDDCLEWMREIILNNKKINPRLIDIQLNKLIDTTEVFTPDSLKDLIIPPFKIEDDPRPVIGMIFGGYLYKITSPNVKLSARKGQLSERTTIYLAPNCELYSIPRINKLLENK